jgi:hypothetical protein
MFCFVQDDDGHWYIVPEEKRLATFEYFEKVYEYWDKMPEDEEEPDEPDWLVAVNTSISYVVFPSYKIGIG